MCFCKLYCIIKIDFNRIFQNFHCILPLNQNMRHLIHPSFFNSCNKEWCYSYTEFFIFSRVLVFNFSKEIFYLKRLLIFIHFFQSLESQTFRLSDLETKLSKRSRIADGRRSARGMRKLDSINAQVSHLRKRIETTSSSYMNDETELQSLIGNKKKVIIGCFFKLSFYCY